VREERTEDEQIEVNHSLYESLDSRYVFLHRDRASSAGDSTLVSNALSFDYRKLIPRGRVQAGLHLARIRLDEPGPDRGRR
jgi:hypothetical protein